MDQMPQPVRARLFLSYGRRDARDLADRLQADLEARGYEVWQDTRRIRGGTDWDQAIREGLRGARLVLALLSPHAVRAAADPGSPDGIDSVCLDEIALARFSQPPKPVVPVMAIRCEPPLFIFRLEFVDLSRWRDSPEEYDQGLGRVLEAIEAALRGEERYRSWVHELKPWDFGALLDEKRRHFCGRQWLFDAIDAWRATRDERALLITGDPGAGKSAMVAELVHRNPDGQVLAYHCCQADTPATLQPGRFVRSLAAMIASRLPAYAEALADRSIQEALSERSCAEDAASAFEAGILAPLGSGLAPERGTRYVLVDALDEALAPGGERAGLTIVDLLAARLERFPSWLRLVATTRKDRTVLDQLRGLRAQEVDAADPRNLEDIDRYLELRLRDPAVTARLGAREGSLDAARQVLRDKCAGNFLYVQQVFQGVERGLYDLEALETLPPGLYGLYLRFFQRQFPDEPSFASARRVLECAVAAQEALPRAELARATALGEDELARALRALAAYLPARDGRYAVYHKSLADWLTAPDREGTVYALRRRSGHERLAETFWAEYRLRQGSLSDLALRHLPTHLREAGRWDDLAHLLGDLSYIEARAAAGQLFALVGDYNAALGAWPDRERYDPFAPWAPTGEGPGPGAAESTLEHIRTRPASTSVPSAPLPSAAAVEAFATFVSAHSHALHSAPRETIPLSRNHAGDGVVVERASALAELLARPWVARDPRPPAPPPRPLRLRLLQGHAGAVTAVAATPDGRRIVSGSEDGLLRVWDAPSGAGLATLGDRSQAVTAVALSHDGRIALSGGEDGRVRAWETIGDRCVPMREKHTEKVSGVALSADAGLAASASWDGSIAIWDLASGERRKTIDAQTARVTALTATPDGRLLLTAGWEGALRVWEVASGECRVVLRGHSFWVSSVAVTADGRWAASAGWDDTVRLWDLDLGSCVRTLEGHVDVVTAVAFALDGRLVVSAGYDRTVRLWDARSGECLRVLRGHSAAVTAEEAASHGGVLVSGSDDRTVRVWDPASSERLGPSPGHAGAVRGATLSVHGRTVLSAGAEGEVRIWSLRDGACQRVLAGHARHVFGVALVPDGTTAVSIGWDSSSARTAETGGKARRSLRVFDVESAKVTATLEGHESTVEAVAVTPDGGTAVSASADRSLRVWDLSSGECRGVLAAAEEGPRATGLLRDAWRLRAAHRARRVGGHAESVTAVTVTPDGRGAVSSTWDKSFCVWDLAARRCLVTIEGRVGLREERARSEQVAGMALTPDGAVAVGATWDRSLSAWKVDSGRTMRTLEGRNRRVERVVITPDGRRAVSAGGDSTLRVWDIASGKCVRTMPGHTGGVSDVALTLDGRSAVSASEDQTLRVWDLGSGECRAVYHAGAAVTALTAVSPVGRLACGTVDGGVQFLTLRRLDQGAPIVTAVVLWRFHPAVRGLPAPEPGAAGRYDDDPTAQCPWCAVRARVPSPLVMVIESLASALHEGTAPCLGLDAEAWTEPALETRCPACDGPWRLNPFLVDNRGRAPV
jgi:WD40 repeat protein